MKRILNDSRGFTIIELLVAILVLSVLAVVAIANIRDIRAENRDTTSKTEINALYYQLEASFERNSFYPQELTEETLKGIDPENLQDNLELGINEEGGLYTYKPRSCNEEGKCKSFELTAQLEKEAPYTKESLNK